MSLKFYLKGYASPHTRSYLSENDFEMNFSTVQRAYYRAVRPWLPIPIRQWLQGRYASTAIKECRPNFVWTDLVDLLKTDEVAWERFVSVLYPNGYKTAIVLTHDVETQEGYDFIPQVIALEQRYGFRSSWNLVPHKYSLRPEIVKLVVNAGNEIGIHGYNHDGTLYFSQRRFLARAIHINRAIKKYGAVGFRSPQVHRDLRWLQSLDVLYDASCFDYDPYQPFPGGTGCIWPFMAGKLVELPYTMPQDHVLFYTLGRKDIAIWKEKADWLSANHGMILMVTHPDYLREKDHLHKFEEFLGYLKKIPNAWHCLPREIAEWYLKLPD